MLIVSALVPGAWWSLARNGYWAGGSEGARSARQDLDPEVCLCSAPKLCGTLKPALYVYQLLLLHLVPCAHTCMPRFA